MHEEMTIEEAKKFLSDGKIKSAGHMAGLLLEKSVKKLCTRYRISLNGLKTRALLDRLLEKGFISQEKNRELQYLITIRNKCDHVDSPVTRGEVQTLIQGTQQFIRWVDGQSSVASPTIRNRVANASIDYKNKGSKYSFRDYLNAIPIERGMSEQKGKQEWIAQGDRALRMGFPQGALDNYSQAAKLDPHDMVLRAKIEEVEDHERKKQRNSMQPEHPLNKRHLSAMGIIFTFLGFLLINVVFGWNLTILVPTAMFGIVVLVLLVLNLSSVKS